MVNLKDNISVLFIITIISISFSCSNTPPKKVMIIDLGWPTSEPVDEKPIPLGGYHTLFKNIVYPESAQSSGFEGTVVVDTYIDETGRVIGVKVLEGFPGTGLDEAAVSAIWKTRFKPAKREGKPVAVWLSIPIVFRLRK